MVERNEAVAAVSTGPAASIPVAGSMTEYISAALSRAHFELMDDEPAYFGEISGLQGVWGKGATIEACKIELQSSLEDWLLFGLVNGLAVPPIGQVELRAERIS